jgi:hypothetical protein
MCGHFKGSMGPTCERGVKQCQASAIALRTSTAPDVSCWAEKFAALSCDTDRSDTSRHIADAAADMSRSVHTGSGTPFGNENALMHGNYSAEAIARKHGFTQLIRLSRSTMAELNKRDYEKATKRTAGVQGVVPSFSYSSATPWS